MEWNIVLMKFRETHPSQFVSGFGPWHPVDCSGGIESLITVSGVVYKVHQFRSIGSDALIVNDSGSDGIVEYLVVAGGGGGGMDMGGGAGGGGVLSGRHIVISGQSLSVTVGAGGLGAPGGSEQRSDGGSTQPGAHQFTISATNGGNSVFGPFTAIGGGHGGSSYFTYTPNLGIGSSGGSGGGTSGYSDGTVKAGRAGTAGQGFRGGQGGGQYYSGGGGGAGGPGVNSTSQPNGGIGFYSDILGTGLYWGGGGGGAAYTSATGGNGGLGGGGGGAVGSTSGGGSALNSGQNGGGGSPGSQTNTRGGNAGVNTGGGGGGGSHYNISNSGGEGGSGIVVVRYPLNRPLPPYITQNLMLFLDAANPASYSGSGSTWNDLSGNGYNATLINSPTYNSSGFFSFNGSNQTASIATNPNIYGVISCEIWVYMNNITSSPCLLHKGGHYTLQISGTNTYYWADSSNYSYANYGNRTATGIGSTGVWKQIVTTKDSSNTVRVYVNGSLLDTRTSFGDVITNNTTTLWIVGYSDTTSTPTSALLNGNVAMCRIYNRELTQQEITINFNSERSRFGI
jgi:hypothetical protein